MDKRIKKLWIRALRSKKYQKSTCWLKQDFRQNPGEYYYDAFGVLCELHNIYFNHGWEVLMDGQTCSTRVWSYFGEECFLPEPVREWAGLPLVDVHYLSKIACMNDEGKSFLQIADFIRYAIPVTEDRQLQLV